MSQVLQGSNGISAAMAEQNVRSDENDSSSRSTLRRLLLGTLRRDENGIYHVDDDRDRPEADDANVTSSTGEVCPATKVQQEPDAEEGEDGVIRDDVDVDQNHRYQLQIDADERKSGHQTAPTITAPQQTNATLRMSNGKLSAADDNRMFEAMNFLGIPKGCRGDFYFFRGLLPAMKYIPMYKKLGLRDRIHKLVSDEIAEAKRKRIWRNSSRSYLLRNGRYSQQKT